MKTATFKSSQVSIKEKSSVKTRLMSASIMIIMLVLSTSIFNPPVIAQVNPLNPAYISGTVSLGDNISSLHINNEKYTISKIVISASGTDLLGNKLYAETQLDGVGNYTLTVNVPDDVTTQSYDVSCKIWYGEDCLSDYFNFETQSVSVTQGQTTALDFTNSGYINGTISMSGKVFGWAWVYIGSDCTNLYTRIIVGNDGEFYVPAKPDANTKVWGYAYTSNRHRYPLECKDINFDSGPVANVAWEFDIDPTCNSSIKGDFDITGVGDDKTIHKHYAYINEATYRTGTFYDETDTFDYSYDDVNNGEHRFTARSFLNKDSNNRYDDLFTYPSEDYISLNVPYCDALIHDVSSDAAFVNGEVALGPGTVVTLSQDAAWDTFIHAYDGNDTSIKYNWFYLLRSVNEFYDVDGSYDYKWWFRDQIDVSTGNYDLILAEGNWNAYYTVFHFQNDQCGLCDAVNPEFINSYLYIEDYSRKISGGQYVLNGGEIINDQDISYETGSVTVKFRIKDMATLSAPHLTGENVNQSNQRIRIKAHGLPDETAEGEVTFAALPGTYKITPKADVNGSVVSFDLQTIEVEAGVCKVVDAEGPALVTDLASEYYTTDAVITISGTVTDDTGIGTVFINGNAVSFVSTGNPDDPNEVSFNTTIDLDSGPNTIKTIVTDTSGKNASDNRKVYRDSGPPVLDWTPSDGAEIASPSVIIGGTATDDNVITDIKINGNSISFTPGNEVSFSTTLSLSDGENQITVSVTDNCNRTSTETRTLAKYDIDENVEVHYSFEEEASDETGNGHDAVIHGAVSVLGISGQALDFKSDEDDSPATPVVTSVSPLTVIFEESTTFTVHGSDLPDTTIIWIDECDNVQSLGGNSNQHQFSCTPSYSTGIKDGIVKDQSGGTTLYSFTVDVQEGTPSVTSVSPINVIFEESTVFTAQGSNLTDTTAFWIGECADLQALGGNSEQRYFLCTPSYSTGIKEGVVKDKPAGTELLSFSVNVQNGIISNAPKVVGVFPSEAKPDEPAVFTVIGNNLSGTTSFYMEDCTNIETLSTTATSCQFSCTPTSPTGIKSGNIKDDPNSNILYEFSVDVQYDASSDNSQNNSSNDKGNRLSLSEQMKDLVSDEFTVSMWINLTNPKYIQYLFHADDDSPGIRLDKDNNVCFRLKPNSSSQPEEFTSAPVAIGEWTHISCTWDGSVYIGYINGEPVGQVSLSSFTLGGRVLIGSDGVEDRSFDGLIDEVKIYDTAMSESKIQDIYDQNKPALIYVDAAFSGTENGEESAPYNSISQAITSISDPHSVNIIRVVKGDYDEALTIANHNSIKIEGGWNNNAGVWERDDPVDPHHTRIKTTSGPLTLDIQNTFNPVIEGVDLEKGFHAQGAEKLKLSKCTVIGSDPVQIENSENVTVSYTDVVETGGTRKGMTFSDSTGYINRNFIHAEKIGLHLNGNSGAYVINNSFHIQNITDDGYAVRIESPLNGKLYFDNNVFNMEGNNLTGIYEAGANVKPETVSSLYFHGDYNLTLYHEHNQSGDSLSNLKLYYNIPDQDGNVFYPIKSYSPCTVDQDTPCVDVAFTRKAPGTDIDGDGMPDAWEEYHFNDIFSHDGTGDDDGDELSDLNEYINGTQPKEWDSEHDGIPDGWEVEYRLDPRVDDALEDEDNDGHTNFYEYTTDTDPNDPASYSFRSVIHVPDDFNTIQEAINSAKLKGGGEVHVAEGTYNENITISDNIWVIGKADPAETTIIGDGTHAVVVMDKVQFGGIIGFTIKSLNNNTTRRSRRLDSNDNITASGIKCNGSQTPVIANCIIQYNRHGIKADGMVKPFIANNIIADNFKKGIIVSGSTSSATIVNNILFNNNPEIVSNGQSIPDISYNIVWNDSVIEGKECFPFSQGNIFENPRFVEPEKNNYRLASNSPGIDRGHEHFSDRDKTRSDIGVYGKRWFHKADDKDENGMPDDWEPYYFETFSFSAENDEDQDGIPSGWEIEYWLNPRHYDAGEDPDDDGLTNLEEYEKGTNPFKADTDDDGTSDYHDDDNRPEIVITANAEACGKIEPPGESVIYYGEDKTYIITPESDCIIADVIVDGQSAGAESEYTFKDVTEDSTIHAVFNVNTGEYTIDASAGENGLIEPNGIIKAPHGSDKTFTITPEANCSIADVIVDGQSVGAKNKYTFERVTEDHTIHAVFNVNTGEYSIEASTGENGFIEPNGIIKAPHGSDRTFTITPEANCHIADVIVDGQSVGAKNKYTFEGVTEDHTIHAVFNVNTGEYTIEASTGENGFIEPNGIIKAPHGSDRTFSITPEECYAIKDVIVNGESKGTVRSITLQNITENYTVKAVFELKKHTVTALSGQGGSISPSGPLTADCGSSMTFEITPDDCYKIKDIIVNGHSRGAVNPLMLDNITGDVTVEALFELKKHTVTVKPGQGGSISPSGPLTADCGSSMTFDIKPYNDCYKIKDVIVNGHSRGVVNPLTLDNITGDVTVEALFELKKHTVTVKPGQGGTISPSGHLTADCGSSMTFDIKPDDCYKIKDVIVNGQSRGVVNPLTLNNITGGITVEALFELQKHTVTVKSGQNGSISPAGTLTADCGSSLTFEIKADDCYKIKDVIVNGQSREVVNPLTLDNITGDITVEAVFELKKHTVTVKPGHGGAISPASPLTADCGSSMTFEIKPDDCYNIKDVIVNGQSRGVVNPLTLNNITGDITVEALFELKQYAVTVKPGQNGSISPSGSLTADCGSSMTFEIKPDDCYEIKDVIVNGQSKGTENLLTLDITEDITVEAVFELKQHTVTVKSGRGGTISPAETLTLSCGSSVTFEIKPDDCHNIKDVIVNGKSKGIVTSLKLKNITEDITVEAVFVFKEYTVTVKPAQGGSISPARSMTIACGGAIIFGIKPDDCYEIKDFTVNGESKGAVNLFPLNNITEDITVEAIFVLKEYAITVKSGQGGSISPAEPLKADCGSSLTFEIKPNNCHKIEDVTVNGESKGAVSSLKLDNITEDTIVEAVFKKYIVTLKPGEGGTISPAGSLTADCGVPLSYEIKPDDCHEIKDVIVKGESKGVVTSVTLDTIAEDITIEAVFELKKYTVTVTPSNGGSISPSGTLEAGCGSTIDFKVNPLGCYEIKYFIIDGDSKGAVNSYTLENITGDHTVEAVFVPRKYTVTVTEGQGGSVSPSGTLKADCGSMIKFNIEPDACHDIEDFIIDDESKGALNSHTLKNIKEDHTVEAVFSPKNNSFIIEVKKSDGGIILLSDISTADCEKDNCYEAGKPVNSFSSEIQSDCGLSECFSIIPDRCLRVKDVEVDGESLGAMNSYCFENIAGNHMIHASFECGIDIGDVNCDKVVDIKDAILILKLISGGNIEGNNMICADINGNGKIGLEEAVYVIWKVGER
ncbi:MAG: hypothetical protein GY795_00815 [Desulfobacterales bacterium]|nr:hypothetical protein [Desulfobacterales bacterium]